MNGGPQCPRCGGVSDDPDRCSHCGRVADAAGDPFVSTPDRAPTTTDGEDVFASPEARMLAERLAVLVSGRSSGVTSAPRDAPADLSGPPPPRPRRATSRMVSVGQRRSGHAGRRRHLRGLLVGAAVLGVTLAGLAVAQVIDQVSENGNGGESASGSLVSADGLGDRSVDRALCWDGSTAADLIACGEPTGLTGLVWVFPSIETDSCESAGRAGGQQRWGCLVRTRSGARAEVVYRELLSVKRGITFYSGVYDLGLADRKQREGRYLWRASAADERGLWQISSMFVDQPWAVHVEADTKKGARQAFAGIEFRPVDNLRGVQQAG